MAWDNRPPVRNTAVVVGDPHPQLHNTHNSDVNEIVKILGGDPAGASLDATARLAALDSSISNVDNTSDANKPVSTVQKGELGFIVIQNGASGAIAARPSGYANGRGTWRLFDKPLTDPTGGNDRDVIENISGVPWV